MSEEKIKVATEFGLFPYGRYPEHGQFNGERFRKEFLVRSLRDGNRLLVDLDGARGLQPSFLEEAFGGLVREGFSEAQLREQITIKSSDDPSYIEEIWSYVSDAAKRNTQ